ncbi:MAG: aromatic ring-hydroxylating dioxygenase subunit alpha [Betaproteobacteria bacterium]|nr:aromatic ring-hydroxylating dioxygenase subunit alpha [Betaproteobacteria bacterium]
MNPDHVSPIEHLLWHPVCDASLVQEVPLSVELLNHGLVLWRDQNGTVFGLHDRCPHRGARLSLGRVCQGQLQCAYHGWTFEGQGQCTQVPALPHFKPGPAQQAKAVAVQERMGLVWVCLDAANAEQAIWPVFAAEWNAGMRKFNAGPYDVATSAPRIVENFLDMSHFSFVHDGWLGQAGFSEIPDIQLTDSEMGFKVSNAQVWQPNTSALSTEGGMVSYTYEVNHPYSAVLTKIPDAQSGVPPGYEESIVLLIQPQTTDSCRVWFRMAVSDLEADVEDVLAFQDKIFSQDKPVLESQKPRLLPLQTGAESNVASDKASVAYRRFLQKLAVTFGVC